MKHLKLFEEFSEENKIWKLKREIPLRDAAAGTYMAFKGKDQLLALLEWSEKRGFRVMVNNPKDKTRQEMINRADVEKNPVFWWNTEGEKRCYYVSWNDQQIAEHLSKGHLLTFEDYFEPVEKYRGHVTGKTYGI